LKMRKRQLWGTISATVLAGLTLAVFYFLQFYGPESAIWQFNEQVKEDAGQGGQLLSGAFSPNEKRFLYTLELMYNGGVAIQIPYMQRLGNEVDAIVLYTFPRVSGGKPGTSMAMIWVVVRSGKVWKVDLYQTAKIFQRNQTSLPENQGP